jgi:hypothetical protein
VRAPGVPVPAGPSTEKWIRPYRSTVAKIFLAVTAIGGSILIGGIDTALVAMRFTTGATGQPPLAFIVGFSVLSLTFMWRWQRAGVLINRSAIRMRWLSRTRTIPWSDVRRFLWIPRAETIQLVVQLRDGSLTYAPLHQRVRYLPGPSHHDGGPILDADDFAITRKRLEGALADARSRQSA